MLSANTPKPTGFVQLADLPGGRPPVLARPLAALADCDLPDVVRRFLSALSDGFGRLGGAAGESRTSAARLDGFFLPEALWQDHLALTSTLRTLYSSPTIASALAARVPRAQPSPLTYIDGSAHLVDIAPQLGWLQAAFGFETRGEPKANCSGLVTLVPAQLSESGEVVWKAWTFTTFLESFTGLPPPLHDPASFPPSAGLDAATGSPSHTIEHPIPVLIIGAGHSGLGLAARLRSFGVESLVVERNKQVGDNWRNRYEGLRLHTIRKYSNLPILPYPPPASDPTCYDLLSAEDLAAFYPKYASQLGLSVLTSATPTRALFHEKGVWEVEVQVADATGEKTRTIWAKHLALTTGFLGSPRAIPDLEGADVFKGASLHSAEYVNGLPFKGKAAVVVGTANSAHDIAESLADAGASSVTMVQRSPTWVLRMNQAAHGQGIFYNDHIPPDVGDRLHFGTPLAIHRLLQMGASAQQAQEPSDFFDGLEKAGFKAERVGDLFHHILVRGGGQCLDTGGLQRIADGEIKVVSGTTMRRLRPEGMVFEDGRTLDADVIVWCTGFEKYNVRREIEKLVSPQVATRVAETGGVDSEGQVLGLYRHTGVPHLWLHGGDTAFARYYSRIVALQIQASLQGDLLSDPYTDDGRRGDAQANGA